MKELALSVDCGRVRVVSVRRVKPLDEEFLSGIKDGEAVITLEENSVIGGFGSLIAEYYSEKNVKVASFGAEDKFVSHGTVEEQIDDSGLTAENITEKIKELRTF